MAGLTTHVLDASIGRPAAGVEIELFALGADGLRTLIGRARTNADGRTDAPLSPPPKRGSASTNSHSMLGTIFARGALKRRTAISRHRADPLRRRRPGAHYHVPLIRRRGAIPPTVAAKSAPATVKLAKIGLAQS